jgi:hypothetical protein
VLQSLIFRGADPQTLASLSHLIESKIISFNLVSYNFSLSYLILFDLILSLIRSLARSLARSLVWRYRWYWVLREWLSKEIFEILLLSFNCLWNKVYESIYWSRCYYYLAVWMDVDFHRIALWFQFIENLVNCNISRIMNKSQQQIYHCEKQSSRIFLRECQFNFIMDNRMNILIAFVFSQLFIPVSLFLCFSVSLFLYCFLSCLILLTVLHVDISFPVFMLSCQSLIRLLCPRGSGCHPLKI